MFEGKPFRVLVVDDDREVREVIAQMFVTIGCDVTSVGDGQKAISAYLGAPYDLITLDYRMPGLDGAALHKLLSEEFGAGKRTKGFTPKKLPPVVVITGHADEPDVIKTRFGESVVGILSKPIALDDVHGLVSKVSAAGESAGERPV
jgi:CheY-like chemotaxis protein